MNLLLTLVLMCLPQIKDDNIMLGKPSKQSSSLPDNSQYNSSKANDDSKNTSSYTNNQQSPYWQGDLRGYYRNLNITVTRHISDYIRGAYIGVSVLDVSCPDSDVHKCGQWPANVNSTSLNFMCGFQQPMRFVRIWREDKDYLNIAEVTVEAYAQQQHRAPKYGILMTKTLAKPGTSMTVAVATECGTLCHNDQTCDAFSFRKGGQLNCLLGIPGNFVSDSDWRTYIIKDCYNQTTCLGAIDAGD